MRSKYGPMVIVGLIFLVYLIVTVKEMVYRPGGVIDGTSVSRGTLESFGARLAGFVQSSVSYVLFLLGAVVVYLISRIEKLERRIEQLEFERTTAGVGLADSTDR